MESHAYRSTELSPASGWHGTTNRTCLALQAVGGHDPSVPGLHPEEAPPDPRVGLPLEAPLPTLRVGLPARSPLPAGFLPLGGGAAGGGGGGCCGTPRKRGRNGEATSTTPCVALSRTTTAKRGRKRKPPPLAGCACSRLPHFVGEAKDSRPGTTDSFLLATCDLRLATSKNATETGSSPGPASRGRRRVPPWPPRWRR